MDILISVAYLISCFLLAYAIMVLPQAKEKLNGIVWGIVAVFTVTLFEVFVAGIYNWVKIPISIISLGILNFLVSIGILVVMKSRKLEKQKYRIERADVIFVAITIAIVVTIAIARYGKNFMLFYYCNGDAARHLDYMLDAFSNKRMVSMYFVKLGDMICVDLFKWIHKYDYYRAFMLYDCYMLLLSVLIFWIAIREYAKSKVQLFIGMVISIAYMLAYPLSNMLDGTAYWGAGMLCVVFSVFCIKRFTENKYNNWLVVIFLLLADCGLSVSYIQFVPAVFIGQAAYLCIYLFKEKKLFSKESWIYALVVFVPATILFVIYGLGGMLGVSVSNVATSSYQAAVNVNVADGRIFRDMYCQFLPLFGFVVLYIIDIVKKKLNNEVIWMIPIVILHECFYLYSYFCGSGATYYYYKNYFLFSFFVFYLGYKGILQVTNEYTRQIIYTYLISLFILWIFCLSGVEQKAVALGTRFIETAKMDQLFQIYADNRNEIVWGQTNVTYPQHEFYRNVGKIRETLTEDAILISNDGTWWWETDNYQYYYNMTGQFDSPYKKTLVYDADTVASEFIENHEYVSIVKSCNLYINNQEYFDAFEVLYENEYAKLVRVR